VREHIRRKFAVGFEDLGEQTVKNIAQPIRVFHLRPGGEPEPEEGAAAEPPPPPPDEVEIEFWDSIKHSTNPIEYQTYLDRYPEGVFAALAEVRVRSLEDGAAAPPSNAIDPKAIELSFWDTVKNSGTAELYRAYLDKYPEGEFAALAEAFLADLSARPA